MSDTVPINTETPPPIKKTVEEWRDIKKTIPWKFQAAKTYDHWPVGKELTEADYDLAISLVSNLAIS